MAKPDFILEFPFSHENGKIQQGIQKLAAYLKLHDVTGVETADQLHWDFTCMFIGPYQLKAPPWESAYLSEERLLFQESTLEVRRSYMKYGFKVQHYRQEADDHLGLELDYMYQLAVLACDRLGQHTPGSGEVLDDSRTFLEEHLLNWIPALTKDIRRYAATPFYQGMADVLEGFLQVDQTLLGQLLNHAALHI
jgi:TorA maturation chaperone TorD